MSISSAAFNEAVRIRGLNLNLLARRTGIPVAKLTDLAEGNDRTSEEELEAIAAELAVPLQAMFLDSSQELTPSIDFRTENPRIAHQAKGTIQALAFVEQLSATLYSLDSVPELDPEIADTRPPELTKKAALKLAKHWRQRWGLAVNEQAEWKDANKVYAHLRDFIEGLGISVLHRSFGTAESAGLYVETPHQFHAIVINTTQSSKARKVFTLAHEFAHVLLGKEGVSNPSIIKNRIERFCNWFAARLLAPKKLITYALDRYGYTPEATDRFIRLLAEKLGISQEATFLRMVETSHLDRAQYVEWKRKFRNQYSIPTGDMTRPGGGGGSSDPVKTKITTYGRTLLRSLRAARDRGDLDAIDIYRISGLKPKYQSDVFEAA